MPQAPSRWDGGAIEDVFRASARIPGQLHPFAPLFWFSTRLISSILRKTEFRRTIRREKVARTASPGIASMTAAKFCSKCGERLKRERVSILPVRPFCDRCSKCFGRVRLVSIATLLVCAAAGFAVGRYTTRREPFYFIGSQIDLRANHTARSGDPASARSTRRSESSTDQHPVISPSPEAETICGARTRSGKPCRRKVKGGGYCWQHRDRPSARQE